MSNFLFKVFWRYSKYSIIAFESKGLFLIKYNKSPSGLIALAIYNLALISVLMVIQGVFPMGA
jgi:hypothetical protein